MDFTMEQFARIKTWTNTLTVDNTADTITLSPGTQITFMVITGNIWINPTATATAANGFHMTAGDAIDFAVDGNLSIISDAATATYKYITWKL